jgi:hypothetical protein
MTIRYSNGYTVDGILLSREGNSMRVAIQDCDEVEEFFEINGTWVSAACQPVDVEFAWMRHGELPAVTEADCICSHELAARLVEMLFAGENPPARGMVQRAAAGTERVS